MTYLDPPRLHFAGVFSADPSTVNNQAGNVAAADTSNTAGYRAVAWAVGNTPPVATGLWNPNGSHGFGFTNVTVRSAVGTDGAPVTVDPVVGLTLTTPGSPAAKLVDLDPDQQMASTIFGMEVAIGDVGSELVRGTFTPAAFTDIWVRAVNTGATQAATYQSTLTDLRWADVSSSPLLTQLKQAATDGLLSIKFTVDAYSQSQRRGRIVGTIGAAAAVDPVHTVVGRRFGGPEIVPNPLPFMFQPVGGINFFPGVLDESARKIRLDLGNAIPTAGPQGGTVPQLGDLTLAYSDDGGGTTPLGPIDYTDPGWYARTAGVVDLPAGRELTEAELAAVRERPLLVLGGAQQDVVIAETPVHVRADEFVARLDPETGRTFRFHVTEFGRPKAGATVDVVVREPRAVPPAVLPRLLAGLQVGTPVEVRPGVVEVTLTGHDPGKQRFYNDGSGPRGALDGQVYFVDYAVTGTPAVDPAQKLSVLVWNAFPAEPLPPGVPLTWVHEIGSLLRPYGNLYPYMTVTAGVELDLAEYLTVAGHSLDIADRLGLPVTDARYMPVTRDLSGQRTQAILDWLDNPGPDGNPLFDRPAPAVEGIDPNQVELGDKAAFAARLGTTDRSGRS